MPILLSIDDFTGYHTLALNDSDETLLQAYITRDEKLAIVELLGVELGEAFIAGIGAGSPDAKWTAIRDEFYEHDTDCNRMRHSRGIKEWLKAYVYYQFVFKTHDRHTQHGVAIGQSETSYVVTASNAARNAERRWNEALDTVEAIQWYVQENEDDYDEEYKGITIEPAYSDLI